MSDCHPDEHLNDMKWAYEEGWKNALAMYEINPKADEEDVIDLHWFALRPGLEAMQVAQRRIASPTATRVRHPITTNEKNEIRMWHCSPPYLSVAGEQLPYYWEVPLPGGNVMAGWCATVEEACQTASTFLAEG